LGQAQTFATVTIKPAANPRETRLAIQPNGDLVARAFSAGRLLTYAYDLPSNPSSTTATLPDWTFSEKYDIDAQAPANSLPSSLQDADIPNRIRQMIRGLLAARFGLVIQVENKTTSVYALTVSTAGPKFQRVALTQRDCLSRTGEESCHNFAGGAGHPLNAKAVDMDDLGRYIANWTDLPVVNHTALTGLFTMNTEGWRPMRLPPPPPGATPAANPFAGFPTLFTVLDELGLELKRRQETVPVYTVEHINRPASN
jgi:uncharacterized protein (TIGR03435 family)